MKVGCEDEGCVCVCVVVLAFWPGFPVFHNGSWIPYIETTTFFDSHWLIIYMTYQWMDPSSNQISCSSLVCRWVCFSRKLGYVWESFWKWNKTQSKDQPHWFHFVIYITMTYIYIYNALYALLIHTQTPLQKQVKYWLIHSIDIFSETSLDPTFVFFKGTGLTASLGIATVICDRRGALIGGFRLGRRGVGFKYPPCQSTFREAGFPKRKRESLPNRHPFFR